jgi:hypothetical protein
MSTRMVRKACSGLWRIPSGIYGGREKERRTVVLHCVKVEADQVGQEEGVLGEVPCAVADDHGVGRVARRPRRRERVCRGHDGLAV